MGFFSKQKKIKGNRYTFYVDEPEESSRELVCPGCGLFAMYTLKVEEKPDLQKLHWSMIYPLVFVFFQIGHYRDKPLDQEAIGHMDEVLSELECAGKDIILRVAYDNTGQGLAHEPGSFEQILEHMGQISEMIGNYRANVLIFQGLLLGSWGEMHNSRYLGTDRMKKLVNRMRDVLGDGPYMAFRRPAQYRRLYDKITRGHKTGLFNDGILGSDDDLGTFGVQEAAEAGWTGSWNRKEEMAFIAELSRYAPVGGEVVLGDHKYYPYTLSQTISHMKGLHVSYINCEYDTRVFDAWAGMYYDKKGPWRKMNGKDYIFRHIGYRLRLEEIDGSADRDQLSLKLTIRNDGFARPYRRLQARVFLNDNVYELAGRLSEAAPGKTVDIQGEVPMAEGNLFMELETDRGEKVPLANTGSEEGRILLGEIW